VMRKLNSDPTRRDVYLWSPAPDSVPPGYHKIWGWVKRNAPSATSWGRGKTDGIEEKTIGKLSYEFRRSLPLNDDTQRCRVRRESTSRLHRACSMASLQGPVAYVGLAEGSFVLTKEFRTVPFGLVQIVHEFGSRDIGCRRNNGPIVELNTNDLT